MTENYWARANYKHASVSELSDFFCLRIHRFEAITAIRVGSETFRNNKREKVFVVPVKASTDKAWTAIYNVIKIPFFLIEQRRNFSRL